MLKKWKSLDPTVKAAIITIIITPLTTAFIVNFQLSKEHNYWKAQNSIVRSNDHIDQKLELLNRSSKLGADISVLRQQLYLNKIYIFMNDIIVSHYLEDFQYLYNNKEFNNLMIKRDRYINEYNELSTEFYSLMIQVSFYYEENIANSFSNLYSLLNTSTITIDKNALENDLNTILKSKNFENKTIEKKLKNLILKHQDEFLDNDKFHIQLTGLIDNMSIELDDDRNN